MRRPEHRRRPVVGASIWQTPGGVVAELNKINDAFLAFSKELTARVTSSPGFPQPTAPNDKELAGLFEHVWTPLIQAWQAFYAENHTWWGNLWWNHAPEAEDYLRQLNEVRATARKYMEVQTPTPPEYAPSILLDPKRNIFDETREAAKQAAGKIEMVALAAAGVAALVLISRGSRD